MTEVNIIKVPSQIKKEYIRDVRTGDYVLVNQNLFLVLKTMKDQHNFASAYSFHDKMVQDWSNKACECVHVNKITINYEI